MNGSSPVERQEMCMKCCAEQTICRTPESSEATGLVLLWFKPLFCMYIRC